MNAYTANCKRAVVFVHVQTVKKENVDRVFYSQALVVLNSFLSNFQSFTCSTIALDYRTLSFNASVKVVLENKKLDPHFLSSKFEHVGPTKTTALLQLTVRLAKKKSNQIKSNQIKS